jgi:hypothetical protein
MTSQQWGMGFFFGAHTLEDLIADYDFANGAVHMWAGSVEATIAAGAPLPVVQEQQLQSALWAVRQALILGELFGRAAETFRRLVWFVFCKQSS